MTDDPRDPPVDDAALRAWEAAQPPAAFEERVMAAWRSERAAASEPAPEREAPARSSAAARQRWSWPILVPTVLAAAALVAVFVRPADRAPPKAPQRAEESPAGYAASAGTGPERPPPPMPVAMLGAVDGTCYVVEHDRKTPARAGQVLLEGHGLLTVGPASAVTVTYPDGSGLDLGPDGFVTLMAGNASYGKLVFVPSGAVQARVARQPRGRPFGFTTPHGEVTVQGTKLSLLVSAAGTRVKVTEGAVRLKDARGQERDVAAGQQALMAVTLAARTPAVERLDGRALLVVGSTTLKPGDELVRHRLEKLGFQVKVLGMGTMLGADIKFNNLIVLSSTVASTDVNGQFRDVAIPLVTWEESLFDDFGMTGAAIEDRRNDGQGMIAFTAPAEIVIKNPWHPLAAALSNTVRVTTAPGQLCWGRPSPFAAWVATFPSYPTQAAIFGYEEGAMMVGMTAPARRVGLFFDDETPTVLSEEGWAIFDAAVRWAVGDRPGP
jgi:ferric-dicitrate binding protein FerR (iron transport regulator)